LDSLARLRPRIAEVVVVVEDLVIVMIRGMVGAFGAFELFGAFGIL
jgi:hypothetical protein